MDELTCIPFGVVYKKAALLHNAQYNPCRKLSHQNKFEKTQLLYKHSLEK